MKQPSILIPKLVCVLLFAFGGALHAQTNEIATLKSKIPQLTDSLDRVAVYAKLGKLYSNRSLDSCYYYSARALDLAKRIGDKTGEAEAMNVLAFYYMEKANPYLAFKYANESLALYRRLRNGLKERELTMNIGVLLSRQGKLDEAVAQYQQAYDEMGKHPRDSIAPLIALNLAFGKSYNTSYAALKPLFDEAQQLAEQLGNDQFLLYIKQARNVARFRSGTPAYELIPEQQEILRQTIESGLEYYTAISYLELGNFFLTVNPDSAQHYYELSISLAEETGYEILHLQAMGQAYEALKAIKPTPPKAIEYSKRLLELGREKEIENQRVGMNYLQLAIKEQEVAAEQARQQLRRTWMILLSVLCALAIVFVLFLLSLYRQKRRLAHRLSETNARLSEQNEKLEKNSAFLQKLVSIMSHDLRQPLSSILMLGKGEMIEQMGAEQRQYIFEQLHQAAHSSLQAMDGIVHWMKLHALGLAYTPSEVNLKENIDEALGFNLALAERKRINIMNFIHSATAILAQTEMLLFVNRNLISNAIKYTPEDGQVMLSSQITEDGQYITVSVSDNGKGIPEQLLPHLFTKERTVQEGAQHGSGLALIICHEMITRMNGKIWAVNNPEGGATFRYQLPLVNQPIGTSLEKPLHH